MKLKITKFHKRILEDSRSQLRDKSKRGSRKRYLKRLNYQVSNFRGVDLSEAFENDYFVFNTPIKDYVCTIAFKGVFTELKKVVKVTGKDPTRVNLQMVIKALSRAFDLADDVKVRCTCADFKYRFMYWAWKGNYLYDEPDPGTEEFPEITNPRDKLGATCKHLDLFLSNKQWLVKAASVINAFIKAYPEKSAYYLYDDYKKDEELPDEDEVEEIEEEEPEEEVVEDTPEEIPEDELYVPEEGAEVED